MDPFLDSEKASISFDLLTKGFRALTEEEWGVAIGRADEIVEKKYAECVHARSLLPEKKRKALKKRNFRNYLNDIALNIVSGESK